MESKIRNVGGWGYGCNHSSLGEILPVYKSPSSTTYRPFHYISPKWTIPLHLAQSIGLPRDSVGYPKTQELKPMHTPGPLIAESMKLLRYHDTLTIPGLILLDF
ncbi:unnamed protein product [Penicillium salamii]|nr:unnamed protein product [Penicillium salamii]CAG8430757.1 unnamed protein product [Penicillium salamii]